MYGGLQHFFCKEKFFLPCVFFICTIHLYESPIPCGLVVRIQRFHRSGRGWIPRTGVSFFSSIDQIIFLEILNNNPLPLLFYQINFHAELGPFTRLTDTLNSKHQPEILKQLTNAVLKVLFNSVQRILEIFCSICASKIRKMCHTAQTNV